jgi:hypothetical protein
VAHAKLLAHGCDTGLRVSDVEDVVLSAVDARRSLSAAVHLPAAPAPSSVDLVFTSAGLVPVEGGEPEATFRCGPAHSYTPGLISLDADNGRVPVGPPVGDVVAGALNRSRELLGADAGRFAPSISVR